MGQVSTEATRLVNETEDSIKACNSILDEQESQACFTELYQEFTLSKNDVINRLKDLYKLGIDALEVAEESLEAFNDDNRQFIKESSQHTKDQLGRCIDNL